MANRLKSLYSYGGRRQCRNQAIILGAVFERPLVSLDAVLRHNLCEPLVLIRSYVLIWSRVQWAKLMEKLNMVWFRYFSRILFMSFHSSRHSTNNSSCFMPPFNHLTSRKQTKRKIKNLKIFRCEKMKRNQKINATSFRIEEFIIIFRFICKLK